MIDKLLSKLSNKVFIPFSDGCLLFDEMEQSVLILNQTAAVIFCNIFEVNSHDELVLEIANHFAISELQARQDIDDFYDDIQKNSLFLPQFYNNKQTSFLTPIENKQTNIALSCKNKLPLIYFSVQHNNFTLSVATEALQAELIGIYHYFISSSYPCTTNKSAINKSAINKSAINKNYTLTICQNINLVDTFSVYVNQQCVVQNLLLENVVPYIFGIVFETTWRAEIVDREKRANQSLPLMFHAAVLAKGQDIVLFPAESGAGKSTLSAVLATKGWAFFSDELAIIDPASLSITPCPLSVCVKPGAIDFLCQYYPQLRSLTLHHRLDDKYVCYLTIPSPELNTLKQSRIRFIIFPSYVAPGSSPDNEAVSELRMLDEKEALRCFLNCGSSGRPLTSDELSAVLAMIEKLPCYALNYSNIDKALTQINSVF